jgi:DNA-binding NarL/FixJ family response regulator
MPRFRDQILPITSMPFCSDPFKLTPRQYQVLRLLSLGMSNKEIAHQLGIAESTTKIHTAMLMRALGVRNRTEAAFKAGKLLSAKQRPANPPRHKYGAVSR